MKTLEERLEETSSPQLQRSNNQVPPQPNNNTRILSVEDIPLETADIPSVDSNSEVAKLKSQLTLVSKQHKTTLDTAKNEALFAARQDYDKQLQNWKDNVEQKHFEDMNRIMEENAKERQRLMREIEIIQSRGNAGQGLQNSNLLPDHNTSAGRISVCSEAGSELFLLDTEFEYLKQVLYKYLKGEHTQHLLKVIIAICRYSEHEKLELLKKSV